MNGRQLLCSQVSHRASVACHPSFWTKSWAPCKSRSGGCVVAPDGGQACNAATAALQKPLLPGVRHAQKLFTPTAKLPGPTCQTETKKRMLTKKIAKKSGRDYIMAAGDNCAEGLLGNIKTTLKTGVFRVQAYTNRQSGSFISRLEQFRLFFGCCFQELWRHPRKERDAFLTSCSQCSRSASTAGTFGPETCQSSSA